MRLAIAANTHFLGALAGFAVAERHAGGWRSISPVRATNSPDFENRLERVALFGVQTTSR
jgi:hypothetical protein